MHGVVFEVSASVGVSSTVFIEAQLNPNDKGAGDSAVVRCPR